MPIISNGGFECINNKEKCGQTNIEKEDTDKDNLKNDELNHTVCFSGPFCEESNKVSENQKQNLNDNLNPTQSNQNFNQTENLNGPNFKSVFIINKPQTDFYRFVRLRQIGQSWYECSNHNYFAIAFFEFYGKLKEPNG